MLGPGSNQVPMFGTTRQREELGPGSNQVPTNGTRRPAPCTSTALDARAADDGVGAVVEADPGLALAVVVGRPHDQRRRAASNLDLLRALRLAPVPDAHEGIVLALAADRGLVGMPGQDAHLVGQRHEAVHHGGAYQPEVTAAH